jgi:hypothetical protein
MPLRSGDHKPTEKLAKDLAGGVGWHDSQPWTPAVKTPIVYPPGKNRQTKITLESDWTFASEETLKRRKCWPVCRHTGDQCPTKPTYPQGWDATGAKDTGRTDAVRLPEPEGHQLPSGDQETVNVQKFDPKPWLDTAPLEVQAKAGYTNFHNDLIADAPILPHTTWPDRIRLHRNGPPRRATEDASVPPEPLKDSLKGLRGRQCRNCLRRVPEDAHGKVRYCSDRCRHRGEYARRRGQAGTVGPGIELSSFAVDGKRVGIDTEDLGFSRLLTRVA